MDLLKVINERKSIRAFKTDPVPREKIEEIVSLTILFMGTGTYVINLLLRFLTSLTARSIVTEVTAAIIRTQQLRFLVASLITT